MTEREWGLGFTLSSIPQHAGVPFFERSDEWHLRQAEVAIDVQGVQV